MSTMPQSTHRNDRRSSPPEEACSNQGDMDISADQSSCSPCCIYVAGKATVQFCLEGSESVEFTIVGPMEDSKPKKTPVLLTSKNTPYPWQVPSRGGSYAVYKGDALPTEPAAGTIHVGSTKP